ncbi:hypothetical protein, partial [Escherichia coli]|uniref:hypothetical protein n=1 Tax=Escherichia coli TaxID=562 RepID=UPI0013D083FF
PARGPAALDGLGDTLDFGDCHIEPSHRFIATVAALARGELDHQEGEERVSGLTGVAQAFDMGEVAPAIDIRAGALELVQ